MFCSSIPGKMSWTSYAHTGIAGHRFVYLLSTMPAMILNICDHFRICISSCMMATWMQKKWRRQNKARSVASAL